jgi:thiamine-phosphate pyrophosphorylase
VALPRLQLITPDSADAHVRAATASALDVGVRWVQARRKTGSDRQRLADIDAVARIARAAGATLVVDDRVDLALAIEADGVHVGLDDLPVEVARQLLGPGPIIGATCRTPDDARRAEAAGATYLGVGPLYASTTKSAGLPDPLGPAGLAAVVDAVSVPVVAISGITAGRVPELLDAGAHGVAVVAAVYGAANPTTAAVELLEALGEPTGAPA